MKKLLMLTALLLAVCAQAQVLGTDSGSKAPKSMVAKKAINLTENQMWWGYYLDYNDRIPVGQDAAQTYDCAICVPANHDFVGASTIKAVRFYLNSASNVSMAKVWISTKGLLLDVDKADYVQDVTVSSLQDGANEILLNTPFVVNNKEIYVGYSFTVKAPEQCIEVGGNYVENSLFVRGSVSVPLWSSFKSFGCLYLHLLVEADYFPTDIAKPTNFGPSEVILGESVDIPVDITNNGRSTITSITYTISSKGVTSAEKTIDVDIPFTSTATVGIPVEADATEGTVAKTLTITKVNGNANNSLDNTVTCNLTTVKKHKTWPRTVLIEEFTNEQNGLCPEAANGLASFMTTYPKLADQVAVVCHHAGDGTDWLTVNASQQYLWFYNSNFTGYAPAFMYDRYYDGEVSDEVTPVEGYQETAEDYKSRVESRLVVPSNVGIDLNAVFSSDKSKVNVTVNCERTWNFSNEPARITVYLTEDNIKAHSQAGASGIFTHQHVLRAVNEVWGKELSWSNNKAAYTYSFNLNPSWKNSDLKVIAFVSSYDYSDPTNCVVENTAVATVGVGGGMGDANNDGKVDIVDVTMAISYILGQNPTGFDMNAADMNGDGKVDIVDVTIMIDLILK